MFPATFMNAGPYGPAVNGLLTKGGHPHRRNDFRPCTENPSEMPRLSG
jgi:hypothetical protein